MASEGLQGMHHMAATVCVLYASIAQTCGLHMYHLRLRQHTQLLPSPVPTIAISSVMEEIASFQHSDDL